MERLVLAVDCDDVLLSSQKEILRQYNLRWNTNVLLENTYAAANEAWQADPATIAERIYDIQLSKDYGDMVPFPDAIEVCRRLATQHELHMVTARPDRIMPVTTVMVEQYFDGVFSKIEHIGLSGNKGDVCHNLKASVLIDDNVHHLKTAAQCGVPHLVWFGDYAWQSGSTEGLEIRRCRDWYEVEAEIGRIAISQSAR
jgi:5'(3')-deoxyribonucleotidase